MSNIYKLGNTKQRLFFMKKLLLMSIMGLFCTGLYAQDDAIAKAMRDQSKKDKEKSDKSIEDPKASLKASTWLSRAKTYENIALRYADLDSSAALTAMEAYKKVVELDKTKKGEPGKDAKEAEKILTGGGQSDLYQAFLNQAVQKYQIKKMGEAHTFFNYATGLYTQDTTAALYGAIAAQQNNDNANAVKGFERFIQNGGKDASVFYSLSQIYKNEKQFDKALDAIRKGIAQNPDNKDLKAEIVNIMISSGDEAGAIRELAALVEGDPKNVTNVLNLAIMYDNGAMKSASEIRQIEDKLGNATTRKARLDKQLEGEKGRLEGFDAEIKRLNGLIAKKPRNLAELNRQLTEAKRVREETVEEIARIEEEAKAVAAAAANVDPAEQERKLADAKARNQEQKKKALENYQKALALEENNYDALYSVGVFYYNEAVEIKKEVDNMSLADYQKRGREVESRICGRFKKARPYFEKAVAVKADSDAKENLDTVSKIISEFESKSVPCVEN